MENAILEVKKLAVGYNKYLVLQDVDFILKQGEILAIIGQNGSGKSTLVKTISGLIPPKRGDIYFDGIKLSKIAPYNLCNMGISYFTQGGLIIPALSVKEHFELASSHNPTKFRKVHIENTLNEFPKLKKLKNILAGNLSGGERQILSLAILLLQNTGVWLLDEPSAGLDPKMVAYTTSFLNKVNKEKGVTMLLVEHNMNLALELATNVAITRDGNLTRLYGQNEFLNKDFLKRNVFN